jgi:hypothetical protein
LSDIWPPTIWNGFVSESGNNALLWNLLPSFIVSKSTYVEGDIVCTLLVTVLGSFVTITF